MRRHYTRTSWRQVSVGDMIWQHGGATVVRQIHDSENRPFGRPPGMFETKHGWHRWPTVGTVKVAEKVSREPIIYTDHPEWYPGDRVWPARSSHGAVTIHPPGSPLEWQRTDAENEEVILQRKGKRVNLEKERITRKEAMALARIAAVGLAASDALIEKYGADKPDGTVIRFNKIFPGRVMTAFPPLPPGVPDPMAVEATSRRFQYAAIRTDGKWYTTGPKSPKGYEWEDLLDWMDEGTVSDIEVFPPAVDSANEKG